MPILRAPYNHGFLKFFSALVGLNLQLKGYEYGGVSGRYLKLYSEPKKNWADARRTCQLEGGELVIVDFPIINEWLAKQDMKYGQLWIGATDMVRKLAICLLKKFLYCHDKPPKWK